MNRPVYAVPLLLALLVASSAPRTAAAAGNETLRHAHDLGLTVDTRWAGGAHGGYYPIRIRLTNTARARALTFRLVGRNNDQSRLPTVERVVQVGQNATLQLTLSVPLVGAGSDGELQVYEDGKLLERLTQHVSLPELDPGYADRPSLLVIHPAPATIDCSRFEVAVQALAGESSGGVTYSGGGPYGGGGYAGLRANDYQIIAPAMLPESWLDYTPLDVVAIPLAALEKIPAAARDALIQWTEAGGTLLVTEIGEPGEKSKDLARLLDLGNRPAASRIWRPAPIDLAKGVVIPDGTPTAMLPMRATGEEVKGADDAAATKIEKSTWGVVPEAFSRIELLAGTVYAFPGNPFLGSPTDWGWWLKSTSNSGAPLSWTARYGTSSRQRHAGFHEFLIPGVGAVPVIAFVVLISIFAVIIGPVNYLVVLRRKQLYLLVITIPVIASLTSAALFGYALVADGFSVQSRLRSMTILDQGTKHAVSFNRISLYAGLAPSGGLRFTPETAVLPIWQSDGGFQGGAVDWTDTQALTSGWLHSRTRTQFETIAHRVERGRVEFTSEGPDTLVAANGLEWPIDAILVRDEAGRDFAGRDLPAGATLKLHPATKDDYHVFVSARGDAPLQAPPGSEAVAMGYNSYRMYGYNPRELTFSQSLLENGLRRLERAALKTSEGGLAPRSYLATFRENPGIELGVANSIPRSGLHALLGNY